MVFHITLTFFSELRLSFFDCGKEHVSGSSSWHSVKTGTESMNSDDVEILGPSVVSTIHGCCHGKTEGDSEFGSRGATAATLGHG